MFITHLRFCMLSLRNLELRLFIYLEHIFLPHHIQVFCHISFELSHKLWQGTSSWNGVTAVLVFYLREEAYWKVDSCVCFWAVPFIQGSESNHRNPQVFLARNMTQPYCFSEAYFTRCCIASGGTESIHLSPPCWPFPRELLVNIGNGPRSLHSLPREKEGPEQERYRVPVLP